MINHMTAAEVHEMHVSVLESVFANQYYVDEIYASMDSFCVDDKSVYEMNDIEEIYSFWNDFWNRLPDDKAIHRVPFYAVCDLAEGDYLIGLNNERAD